MFLKILDKTSELIIPHHKMIIAIRRTGMYKIKIELLTGIHQRKIAISPHSLRKILSFVSERIFTEYHASYERFGSGGIVGVRIFSFQQVLEVFIMMVGKFYEHEHIGISVRNGFFDSFIVDIVLMDVCK